MDRSPETTYRIMSAVKSKDTEPERILGKHMWKLGLRYRKHYKILGKPDFVFIGNKIAVFCDGDFWHGNNWKLRGIKNFQEELRGYSSFWREKISRKSIARSTPSARGAQTAMPAAPRDHALPPLRDPPQSLSSSYYY